VAETIWRGTATTPRTPGPPNRTGITAAEQFVVVVVHRVGIAEPPHTVSGRRLHKSPVSGRRINSVSLRETRTLWLNVVRRAGGTAIGGADG